MNNVTFNIECYTDPNSGNHCEVVTAFIGNKKVYERDYGSQTLSLNQYREDYYLFLNKGIQEC